MANSAAGDRIEEWDSLERARSEGDADRSAFAEAGGDSPFSAAEDRSVRRYTPPAIAVESPTFPLDAFIIPEGTARLPCGIGEAGMHTGSSMTTESSSVAAAALNATATEVAAPGLVDRAPLSLEEEKPRRPRSASLREQRAHDVADRLEALATQLRHHGYEVLAQKSVRGDALDALLAGVIAGYLVASE